MSVNTEIANLLRKVSSVFRVKEGDTFRYKAYQNAAVSIENASEPLDELWRQDKLDTISGLGESLIGYLDEYFKKGKVGHFEKTMKQVPAGMFELMNIRGVGPITAYKIAKKFKLNTPETAISELKSLIADGKLSQIPSFKQKTIEKISKSMASMSTENGRMLLSESLLIATKFVSYLKQSPDTVDAVPLGSLRRCLSTTGDIDLALCTDDPATSMAYVLANPEISSVISSGKNVSRVKLKSGHEVDIKISNPDDWGSLLQHYTGSKLHNIKLRTLALSQGLSLSEYGIKRGTVLHHFSNEKAFYKFLHLDYIPPELREDKGEIELARGHHLPKLIELEDIKGDLHIHSNFHFPSSHDLGASSLSEYLAYAEERHYEYIGISDHNPKAIDLSEKEREKIILSRKSFLEAQLRAYEKAVKKRAINVLNGMEVDIKPNGDLALEESCLRHLDYAIVSIHSSFSQNPEESTHRIIQGLSHPKAVILGHPTARMLNERDQIQANWEQIFDFMSKNKKIVEINSSPSRLDLPDDLIHLAISKGVKVIIDTDSHGISGMDFMKFGVWQARRGWVTKKSLVNALSFEDLQGMLNLK